ncbi:DNA-binding transcriptional regulator YhcF (GntR family) [Elusimicrobium posterum]|uniref:hypothetical protein n=1 Tax=Elusimicrobium posterum TaxID=3116653 RepID=UPI003C7193D2
MTEEKKKPFTPLYKEAADAILKRCGVMALGCFAAMARRANYSGGWVLEISLRDLAAYLGVSINTLKKSLLQPLAANGFINVDSPDRVKTRITLTAMADIESGKELKTVSNNDTEKVSKKETVSKNDTDFSALFPEFIMRVDRGSVKVNTGAATTEESGENMQAASKIDTESCKETVSNSAEIGQSSPPLYPIVVYLYIKNKKTKKQKQKNKKNPRRALLKK